jgi:hypothetical protein
MRGNIGEDVDAEVDARVKKILAANSEAMPNPAVQAVPEQKHAMSPRLRRHRAAAKRGGSHLSHSAQAR